MAFLTAEWRKLIIANYAVDSAILQPFRPAKTEFDLWNGKCYVSLVAFLFVNTKLKGIRIPFHINFEEMNLRFYVKHLTNENEKRRGVCFIKEIVSKPALAIVANTIYHENYETMRTSHELKISTTDLEVKYKWKKKNWNSISVSAENKLVEMAIDSEEEFITEHFWGYTKITNEKTSEYPVHHPRWKVYHVNNYAINVDFGNVYGNEFEFLNQLKPVSVMLAEGSEISVHAGRKI